MAIVRVHVEVETDSSVAYEVRDSLVSIIDNAVNFMPGNSSVVSEVED